jgi:hypothetical protein
MASARAFEVATTWEQDGEDLSTLNTSVVARNDVASRCHRAGPTSRSVTLDCRVMVNAVDTGDDVAVDVATGLTGLITAVASRRGSKNRLICAIDVEWS